ncbi:phosphotransferase [Streptomyces sp. NPDC020412]|uniref:phosphotransferase n=1 Tax=Streptomyces sp. NPDC020412 TaxID=3365073 RepID=UPI0037B3344C
MPERVGWEGLPAGLREQVEERTGRVVEATTVDEERSVDEGRSDGEGLGGSLATVVRTERQGRLFLKGVRNDGDVAGDGAGDGERAAALAYEQAVNRAVAGVGPSVRHAVRGSGWLVLAFIHVDGRHADFRPGTHDLAAVDSVVKRMARLKAPRGVRVPAFAERYADRLAPRDAELLAGETLLHTDVRPRNVLIGHAGGHAYVVDWARAATGPAWVDPARTAVALMAAGQPVDDALGWLATFPAWRRADPSAVRAFVSAADDDHHRCLLEK